MEPLKKLKRCFKKLRFEKVDSFPMCIDRENLTTRKT